MPRFKRYSRGRTRREKYSRQCVTLTSSLERYKTPTQQQHGYTYTHKMCIIPSTLVQGVRRVKNMSIDLVLGNSTSGASAAAASDPTLLPGVFAVVFNPEGLNPNDINESTQGGGGEYSGIITQAYYPEQNLMMIREIHPNAGSVHINIPVNKNLNSGDSIHLLLKLPTPSGPGGTTPEYCTTPFAYTFTYSIAY